jgi:SHS2 domain-containing protein
MRSRRRSATASVPFRLLDQHGAVPKAISYHGLELRENAGTSRCRVTVDV